MVPIFPELVFDEIIHTLNFIYEDEYPITYNIVGEKFERDQVISKVLEKLPKNKPILIIDGVEKTENIMNLLDVREKTILIIDNFNHLSTDVLDKLYELYQAKTITILGLYYTGWGEYPVYHYSSYERFGLNTFEASSFCNETTFDLLHKYCNDEISLEEISSKLVEWDKEFLQQYKEYKLKKDSEI